MTLDPNTPEAWPPGEWDRWVREQPWIRMRTGRPFVRDMIILLEPEAGIVARSKYPEAALFTLEDMQRIMDGLDKGAISTPKLEAIFNIASKFGAGFVPENEQRSAEPLYWVRSSQNCKLCGGNKWWTNRGGSPVCHRCHPPTGPASS